MESGEDAAHAVAEHRNVFFSGILGNAADAFGNEIERVVLEHQPRILAPRRAPIDQVDFVTPLQQKLDKADAGRQIEDVGPVEQRHDQQHRYPVDLADQRFIAVELQRAALVEHLSRHAAIVRRGCREKLDAPDAALDGPLDFPADTNAKIVGCRCRIH